MEIRRDIALGPGIIAFICVVVGFATIGLFARMTPAIESILKENVESQEAARDILEAVAARATGDFDEKAQTLLRTALERARRNITIAGEATIVDALGDAASLALIGDDDGFRGLARLSRDLWNINHQAMVEADHAASRLGTAGAWTAVFGGLGVVLATILVIGRMRRRIAVPLEDIGRVVQGHHAGGHHLRCRPLPGLRELEVLREHLNGLFDDLSELRRPTHGETGKAAMRQALVATLGAIEAPAAVVHSDERIVAGNPAGLAFFSNDYGMAVRTEVADRLDSETPAGRLVLTRGEGHDVTVAWHPLDGFQAALVIIIDDRTQPTEEPSAAAEPEPDEDLTPTV